MNIQIFSGLPYNKWVSWEEFSKSGDRSNPFRNFKLSKNGFSIQVNTQLSGELDITINLPNSITFTV